MEGRLKAASNDHTGKRSKVVPPQETMTLVNMALEHKIMPTHAGTYVSIFKDISHFHRALYKDSIIMNVKVL